jgi:hypothetical protein
LDARLHVVDKDKYTLPVKITIGTLIYKTGLKCSSLSLSVLVKVLLMIIEIIWHTKTLVMSTEVNLNSSITAK